MKLPLNIDKHPPKKSLGQNFIIDKNFLKKLANSITSTKQNIIIEIGPGKGALTHYLSKKNFKQLILIEKDFKLASLLKKLFIKKKNIIVINEDALKFNYSIFKESVIIVGNLPYNISTQLLVKWLEFNKWPPFYEKMILMFQRKLLIVLFLNIIIKITEGFQLYHKQDVK